MHGLRRVDWQAGDLEIEGRRTVLGPGAHHDHVPAVGVLDQEERDFQASERRPRPVRQVRQRGCRQTQRRQPLAGEELLQSDRRMVRWDREAVDSDLPSRLGRPGIQRRLQVHLLERRERTRNHRQSGGVLPEKVGDELDHLVAGPRRAVDPLEERAERVRELAGLGVTCVRHRPSTLRCEPHGDHVTVCHHVVAALDP